MTNEYVELLDVDGITRKIPMGNVSTIRIYGLGLLQIIGLARNFEAATKKDPRTLTAQQIIDLTLKVDWKNAKT